MNRMRAALTGAALAVAILAGGTAAAAPQRCESLAGAAVADTVIHQAATVQAGTRFVDANAGAVSTPVPVCRVIATVSTQPGEKVGVEIWLPLSGWNGRFEGLGSGGFGGSIGYAALVPAVARGFAAASTDTGHVGGSSGAIGSVLVWAQNPVALRDWGHSAVHLMTVSAKRIVRAFYGEPAGKAYFAGCSTGGAEAMEEAQFFPDDYDGIHAGSPGQDYSHLMESFFWGGLLPARNPAARLSPAALALLNKTVLQDCGGAEAARLGFLLDPRSCRFDPAKLLCRGGQDASLCLTRPQVAEAARLYAPVTDPVSGLELYPGFARGSESQWGLIQGALIPDYAQPLLANALFGNPNWKWESFDFHKDAERVDRTLSPVINATDPDLRRFQDHGGKLIVTQGWADALNAQTLPIEYYDSVVAEQHSLARTLGFARLFMVPGMSHCGHGPGPTTIGGNSAPRTIDPEHDVLAALQAWVEHGTAPDRLVASKYNNDDAASGVTFELPVCHYPEVVRYRGTGDARTAARYACVNDEAGFRNELRQAVGHVSKDRPAGDRGNLSN